MIFLVSFRSKAQTTVDETFVGFLVFVHHHVRLQNLLFAEHFSTKGLRTSVWLRSRMNVHVCFQSSFLSIVLMATFVRAEVR